VIDVPNTASCERRLFQKVYSPAATSDFRCLFGEGDRTLSDLTTAFPGADFFVAEAFLRMVLRESEERGARSMERGARSFLAERASDGDLKGVKVVECCGLKPSWLPQKP
jgi:hypothetical protein